MGTMKMWLVCVLFSLVICQGSFASALSEATTSNQNRTQPQSRKYNNRGSQRHNTALSATPVPHSPQHNEIKELMANLHDRVGVLATLDEDQRKRLETIDKKMDTLLESNSARMESLKVQQLNFQQRLDSFEHIQRLTRNTLDELKGETDAFVGPRMARQRRHKQKNRDKMMDLSRQTRQTRQDPRPLPHVEANMNSIFSRQPATASAVFNGTKLDVDSRFDALATLLASVAQHVTKTEVNTNNIWRRLAGRKRGQSAQLPQSVAALPAPVEEVATSCLQSYLAVKGILKIQLTPLSEAFYVPCEQNGWTVVMQRTSDDVNFERSWVEYEDGFGNLAADFFIGLKKLHALTASELHEVRFYLEDFEGNVAYAGYDAFAISGYKEHYAMNLLGKFQNQLSPSAGDSLSYQAGAKFSTFDNDNDNCVECNCAHRLRAAGWFNNCATSNLMGVYHTQNQSQAGETGIYWDTFQGKDYSLRSVKMLIRPVVNDEARR